MQKELNSEAFYGGPMVTTQDFVSPDESVAGGSQDPKMKPIYDELKRLRNEITELRTLLRNNGIS